MLNKFQKFLYNFSVVFPCNIIVYLAILLVEWIIVKEITDVRKVKMLIVIAITILIELILIFVLHMSIKKLPKIAITIFDKKNIENNKIIVLSNIIIPIIIRLGNNSKNISNTIGLIILIVILIVIAICYSIGDGNIANPFIFLYHFYCVSIEMKENKKTEVMLLSKKKVRDFTKIKYVKRIFENMFIVEEELKSC